MLNCTCDLSLNTLPMMVRSAIYFFECSESAEGGRVAWICKLPRNLLEAGHAQTLSWNMLTTRCANYGRLNDT
jgi:hypothetical protein